MGRIVSAFAVVRTAYGVLKQTGPVRLDFTDRRFVVVTTVPPTWPPALALYRSWKASLPPGPVCRLFGSIYLQEVGEVLAEIPNDQVSSVRAHREVGLWVDKSVSDLDITNVRRGFQFVLPGSTKRGVYSRDPRATHMVFRVPAPPDEIDAFLRRTPLAGVLRAP